MNYPTRRCLVFHYWLDRNERMISSNIGKPKDISMSMTFASFFRKVGANFKQGGWQAGRLHHDQVNSGV